MSTFTRFVFQLLLVGIIVNLTIVLIANAHSRARLVNDTAAERGLFEEAIARQNNHVRRGTIAVEWQRIDASQQVLETSILVRQYADGDKNEQIPLPIVRIIIPGGRVYLDGILLEFDALFNEDYKALRNTRLSYFSTIYGENQDVKERLNLLPFDKVPTAFRVHPDHVTHYELQLWRYLSDMIQNPRRAATFGIKVTHTDPASRALKNGTVYSIFVGVEGANINESDDRSVLNDMLKEIAASDAAKAANLPEP